MNTTLSLTPIMRHSVGFDRFNDLFDSVLNSDNSNVSYPPYNIEKCGENDYAITMAVAGFDQSDLNIMVQNDHLTVTGCIEEKIDEDSIEFLHRGIATRTFERSFRLADHMQVVGAEMKHGMLRIKLERLVPEEAKPRMITITSANEVANNKKKVKPL